MLISAVILWGAWSCQSETEVHRFTPAAAPTTAFTILRDGAALTVIGSNTMVHVVAGDFHSGSSGVQAAAVDQDRAVLVGNDQIGIVSSDGSLRAAPCEGCEQALWTGSSFVVLKKTVFPENSFALLQVNANDLSVVAEATVHRPTERTSEGVATEDGGVTLLAANSDSVWIAYENRFGGARFGERTVAVYSLDGHLLDTTAVEGRIYSSSVSPNGRYLAIADGGSSGACASVAALDVIDLVTLDALATTPAAPPDAHNAASEFDDVYYFTSDFAWDNDTLVTMGRSNNTDCEDWTSWRRTYSMTNQTLVDQRLGGAPVTFADPTCTTPLVESEDGGYVVSVPGTERESIQGHLLLAPRATTACWTLS